jgi:DNA-binding GntR family transcriptional regulator
MTVNKAMGDLVTRGYIRRIPGKGSFVRLNAVSKSLKSVKSFTADMELRGIKPGAKLLEYTVKHGGELPSVRDKLGLGDDDLIHYFVRLRTGDGEPVAVSHTYISGKCLPSIDINSLESSFYEYAIAQGIEIKSIEGDIVAVLPTEKQKEILNIKNEALLLNSHITRLKDGRIMEYIQTYYIGSKYTYSYITENVPPAA